FVLPIFPTLSASSPFPLCNFINRPRRCVEPDCRRCDLSPGASRAAARGRGAQGQGVLGAMVAGAVLWITEATPIGLTAIIVVVLLALCPDISLAAAGSGLASEVVFFLNGAVAIGAAVEASGLAERAARYLGRMAQGSPARLYVQMIASLPAFAVLVPSAITRNAILIPAYRDARSSAWACAGSTAAGAR